MPYTSGQLGDGEIPTNQPTPIVVSGISGAFAIATGANHSLVLNANGTMQSWGNNRYRQLGNARELPGLDQLP